MDIDQRVIKIIEKINDLNYQTVIVGGFVRDYLLNISNADYDLSTNADLDEIKNLFDNVKEVKINDQLIMLKINEDNLVVELSRFRKEIYDDENNISFEFTDDYTIDADRRDLAINAIAYDYIKNEFLDPHLGIDDLKANRLSVIGDYKVRFIEDPVRMLRVLRFISHNNLKVSEEVISYIKDHYVESLTLAHSSHELKQILSGTYFNEVYTLIPELFDFISKNKFKNIQISDRSILKTDIGLLVYLIYIVRIGACNEMFNYVHFSEKDRRFCLDINVVLDQLTYHLEYSDVSLLFIKYGKDTMLKVYEYFKDFDYLNLDSVKLIKEVEKNSYIRIDELKVSINDLDSSYSVQEKYELLKELQERVVCGRLQNKRELLLKELKDHN